MPTIARMIRIMAMETTQLITMEFVMGRPRIPSSTSLYGLEETAKASLAVSSAAADRIFLKIFLLPIDIIFPRRGKGAWMKTLGRRSTLEWFFYSLECG